MRTALYIQCIKQYQKKLWLNGVHFSARTLEFHPQMLMLEPPCAAQQSVHLYHATLTHFSFKWSQVSSTDMKYQAL